MSPETFAFIIVPVIAAGFPAIGLTIIWLTSPKRWFRARRSASGMGDPFDERRVRP